MPFHVVVGAGATGSATARLLAAAGTEVRIITRRGTGPAHDLIERVAADAADAGRLVELIEGATTLYNCAMPPYHRWPAEFPPLAGAVLAAVQRVGADYVMLGNTYGYGPVDGLTTENLPLVPISVKGRVRAKMWQEALAAHEAGRVRVTEIRASDFLGAGAYSPFTLMVGTQVLSGTAASYPGDIDAEHSWTYTGDAARTLIAAAHNDGSWGHAWHVPSTSDLPVRDLAIRLATAANAPTPQLNPMTRAALEEIGRTDPVMAEFPEMLYLYDRPAVLDASMTMKTLGVTPTPIDDVLNEMATEHAKSAPRPLQHP